MAKIKTVFWHSEVHFETRRRKEREIVCWKFVSCVSVTRVYGDHAPLTESWKALDVMLCRCTCRMDEDV